MGKMYQGSQMPIIIWIPKNTFRLEMKAEVADDDDTISTIMKLDPSGIQQARQDYLTLDPYDDAFDTYVIIEEGERCLEEQVESD